MAEVSDIQLNNISNRLEKISARMSSFGSSLTTISTQLSEASSLERMKEQQQQNRERLLAEQQLREGKESTFERKMQSALVSPMQRVAAPAQGILETLKRLFIGVVAGWLTKQGIDALNAYKDDNKKKLEEIRDNVLGTLRKIVFIFALARYGISGIVRTIGRIGGFVLNGVYQGLIRKPFSALMNAIKGAIGRAANSIGRLFGRAPKPIAPPTPTPNTGGRPGKGGGPGFFGSILTGLSGAMNFMNGEYVDSALAALSMVPRGGIFFKGVRVAFAVDELMEAFGKNFTGADPKLLKQKREEAEAYKQSMGEGEPKPATTSTSAKPTESLMGDKKGDTKGVEANTSQATFKKEDELKKGDTSGGTSAPPSQAQVSSTSTGSSTPAQVSSAPKADMSGSVGPEPKSEPTVQILPSSGGAGQSVPVESGAQASSIPNIRSSNIDNFYTLYSQINYNVVV